MMKVPMHLQLKKDKDNLMKKRIRDDESPDTSTVPKIKDKTSKKRKLQSCQQDAVNVHDDKEMKRSVERAIKEAKHIYYTGHKISRRLVVIGPLCVLYAIASLLV